MSDLFPDAAATEDRRGSSKASTSGGRSKTVYPSAAAAIAELETRHGKRTAFWTYANANGDPVAVVIRWDNKDGKTFRPVAKVGANWRIGDPDDAWPLYRLPELLQSHGRLYICEGERPRRRCALSA